LSASIVCFADSAFDSPSRSVEWTIWRCRLVVAAKYAERPDAGRGQIERGGGAQAAGADQQHARVEELDLALLADLGDQQVAAVSLALVGVERPRQHGREAVPLPVRVTAREGVDRLVAHLA